MNQDGQLRILGIQFFMSETCLIDFQDFGQLEENHPLGAEYDQFSK